MCYAIYMKELIDQTIESQIIYLLKDGSLSTIKIIDRIQKTRPDTPKQSVYLALRKLKSKEIIVLRGKMVSLHQSWVVEMKNFFTEIDSQHLNPNEANLLNLQDGESVTYKFNSLVSLDMFWAHAFMLFVNTIPTGGSIFLYNPHEWFLIARKQSEVGLIKEVKRREIHWQHLIASKKPLDTEITKYFDGNLTQCHLLNKHLFENNYYLNNFGNFHIEVWLDKRAVEEIEMIYNTYNKLDIVVINLLRQIIENKKYKHKMKISKNTAKGVKIFKLFKKYFFIKK